ncbi:hypothetical protein Ae201684P_016170 [Aphanomyces euteiches]|nr:hypothetical protein Ae201684P_016170 [Aphanomyces euteiches]
MCAVPATIWLLHAVRINGALEGESAYSLHPALHRSFQAQPLLPGAVLKNTSNVWTRLSGSHRQDGRRTQLQAM